MVWAAVAVADLGNGVVHQLAPVRIALQHEWVADNNQERLGARDAHVEALWVSHKPELQTKR